MADEEREEQEVGLKTREGAEQAAALDSITDHVSTSINVAPIIFIVRTRYAHLVD